MYFTDDFNPWRVINNGFVLKTGLSNNRYVTGSMITNGSINGINENDKHPIVNLINIAAGGSLLVGNYFFFVRYTDLNFSTTSFLGQSGPVPIFNTVFNGQQVAFGGEVNTATDKAVDLNISNLDTTTGFFEIGFIRYYGKDIFETFLIDKRYSIAGQPFRVVRITGNEPLLAITLDELIVTKPSDAVYCRDLTQLLNNLYIANTRGPQLDHPDLRQFMCALSLDEGLENNGPAPEIRNDQNVNPYGIDATDTHDKVGYMSGEAYIFACIPVFKGGFIGLPYPMTGKDNYNGLGANSNKSGIYRFKRAHLANYWDGTDTYIKNIQVNTTNAIPVYNSSQWLQDNLIGIYIARGDRNKVVLYQGLSVRCYNGKVLPELYRFDTNLWIYENTGNSVNRLPFIQQPNPERWTTDRVIPLFEPASYEMVSYRISEVVGGGPGNYNTFLYAAPYDKTNRNDFTDPTRLAVFCTDYYIDKVAVPDTVYVQLVAITNYGNHWRRESTGQNPVPITNRNAINGFMPDASTPFFDPLLDALQNTNILPANQGVGQSFVGYNQSGLTYQTGGFQSASLNITGYNAIPNQNFVSRLDEGKLGSQDGLYYFERRAIVTNSSEYEISLPFATPDYIALPNAPTYTAPNNGSGFDHYVDIWDRAIVNVCRTNPDFINYLDLYDFKNTEFYPIGSFQPIADFLNVPTHTYYRGDCLVTRSYLKLVNGSVENLGSAFIDILTNVIGSGISLSFGNGAEAQQTLQQGFGHWVSMVTEHSYNPNYRHELGRNLFYPKTNLLDPGVDFAWLYDSPESYFYNKGYSEYLGPKANVGIDLLQPVSNNIFPTRIRPSITHIFGAVRDGYRQFIPADAKDFEYSFGEIEAIEAFLDMLYSFQQRAINLHPVNERVTQQGQQGSTAVLGESTGLTQYKQTLKTDYGTQNRFSIVHGNNAMYCIDYRKRAVLRIGGGQVQHLDIEKEAQTWFRNIIALYSSGYSDALEILPNEFPCSIGVHGIYNRKYKVVLWTFRFGEKNVTIAFSEEMDCFLGTHGHQPIHYALVEEDLYSFVDHEAWLHDKTDKYCVFYGVQDEWYLKYVTNEAQEIAKYWSNIIINSNNRQFSKIEYETQHQTAIQDPFMSTVNFWYAPTYRENQWRLPIRRQDATKEPEENIYDDFTNTDAPLRGTYLITKLTYNNDKELWVSNIITFYNQSFV
jgi:hypothetical protein